MDLESQIENKSKFLDVTKFLNRSIIHGHMWGKFFSPAQDLKGGSTARKTI